MDSAKTERMGELDDGSNFISEETDGDEAFYKWRTIHECEESGGEIGRRMG